MKYLIELYHEGNICIVFNRKHIVFSVLIKKVSRQEVNVATLNISTAGRFSGL